MSLENADDRCKSDAKNTSVDNLQDWYKGGTRTIFATHFEASASLILLLVGAQTMTLYK